MFQMSSSEISVPCEVAGCGWRSPLLPVTLYAAMVDQLKLHQASVHDAQSPLAAQPSLASQSLSLPCHTSQWGSFLAQWSSSPARLAASSEDQRVAVLLEMCGQEVSKRLRAWLGPGLDSLPEEEVLAALKGVSVGWGSAVARLLVHTLARGEGEGVAQFSGRLQLLATSSSFFKQCSTCENGVDFSSQVIRDRLLASIGAQVTDGIIESSTVEEVVKWAEMNEEREGGKIPSIDKEVLMDTVRKDSTDGDGKYVEKVDVMSSSASMLEGAEEMDLAEEKPQNKSGSKAGGKENFKCQKCPNIKVFKTMLGLNMHQKVYCSGRVVIKCSICSKAFKTRSGCSRHYKKCHQNLLQASELDNEQELVKQITINTNTNNDIKIEVSGAHSQDLATHEDQATVYIPVSIQTGNSSKKMRCKMLRNTPMRRMLHKVNWKFTVKIFCITFRCLKI